MTLSSKILDGLSQERQASIHERASELIEEEGARRRTNSKRWKVALVLALMLPSTMIILGFLFR